MCCTIDLDNIALFCVLLSSICVHCLANVVSSIRSESFVFTVCLLQLMYGILLKENASDLVQHLSVNVEKACKTFIHVSCYKKYRTKLKMNILYHMPYIEPILLFWWNAQ